ncbi:hypothetical protein CGZ80_16235 [Rhodopirellula sp. MGV]|nr:hypothetical protein CGZ80_16235 [Rhodopirellula sp. MGV]PNY38031.1 hypothetical protein C2E31_04530 [Rhodopirellula baltica]
MSSDVRHSQAIAYRLMVGSLAVLLAAFAIASGCVDGVFFVFGGPILTTLCPLTPGNQFSICNVQFAICNRVPRRNRR